MKIQGATIAVTGAGGFIGLSLVERFARAGAKVRGLELSPKAASGIERAGAEAVIGDITNAEDATRACAGADVVVNTAAIVGEGGDLSAYRRVNVEGARTVAKAGAKRIVHLSSVMVYGFDFPLDVGEDGPKRGEGNAYCQTKIESEDALMDLHRRGIVEVTIIRPGDVYGRGSVPWVTRPLDMIEKRLFALPPGGKLNLVHVENLVDGIVLAIERDAIGEAFNVSDGVATPCEDYFARLAKMVDRRPPLVLPRRALSTAFSAIEKVCDRLGVEPPARADAVSFLTRPNRYSIEKARRVLGYQPRITLDEGLADIQRWVSEGRPHS